MLAATITNRLHDPAEDLPPTPPQEELPDAVDVLKAARGPWKITAAAVKAAGDWLLVTYSNTVVGVYRITAVHRDPSDPRLATFDLEPATSWQWVVGGPDPFPFRGNSAAGIKKIPPSQLDILRKAGPVRADSPQGWTLDVAADGRSAIVRVPAASVSVTQLQGDTVHLAASGSGQGLNLQPLDP